MALRLGDEAPNFTAEPTQEHQEQRKVREWMALRCFPNPSLGNPEVLLGEGMVMEVLSGWWTHRRFHGERVKWDGYFNS